MRQITIYDLLPLLRKGWVAMSFKGWAWFSEEPIKNEEWNSYVPDNADCSCNYLDMFNIAPFAGDWKDSLMECGK